MDSKKIATSTRAILLAAGLMTGLGSLANECKAKDPQRAFDGAKIPKVVQMVINKENLCCW